MNTIDLILADDDSDDCIFFKEALEELPITTSFSHANNGVELMNLLEKRINNLPQLIFLDLNMPLKTGADCLTEIKSSNILKTIPVVIFSTSYDPITALKLFKSGANRYVKKPTEFSALKSVINKTLVLYQEQNLNNTSKDSFLIQP